MKLQIFEEEFSVCQLGPNEPMPKWVNWTDKDFLSVSRTDEELTIITRSSLVPEETLAQHNFACFRVTGDLDFDIIGVIARISTVLANEKIPILSISTYNTDYFLIPKTESDKAVSALNQAGYEFT